jgi:hypothetical protein
MNKKIVNKIKKSIIVFLAVIVSSVAFIVFPHGVRADSPSVSVYYLVTSDTTPLIKGRVSDASASVSVVIIGYVDREATVAGDGSWSLQLEPGEALTPGDYAVGVASVIGGELVSDSAYIYIDEEYPIEIYYESEEGGFTTSLIVFTDEYTYDSEDGNFSLTFSAGTEIAKTGGGTFDISQFYAEIVDPNNERIILKLRFGVPNVDLTFSKDVTITFNVGEEYNGKTLNMFSRSDGGDDGWEPMGICCDVINGSCSFGVSHASYFAISEDTSIAETEEGEMGGDSERAKIYSWKAYLYDNNKGASCKTRLVLEIKGKRFDKDAEVRIGSRKAYSVKRKSSRKIVAKFCMDDLLKVNAGEKRTVSVANPNTDRKKADEKINLSNIGYRKFTVNDLTLRTIEGIKNIQKSLISLGFLDGQYVTGFYGPITRSAVVEFQRENNIPQTGYVGPLTKLGLEEKLK